MASLVLSFLLASAALSPSILLLLQASPIKTEVHRSPKFLSEPGSVTNKFYYNIDFPKGHIGIKSFDAELVDEEQNPIPLHEAYLHHWLVFRYYQRIGTSSDSSDSDRILVKNSGVCEFGLTQYFGLGAETRKTPTDIPDPYGLKVGRGADVPKGFEERWMLNVHAIDTRGAEDGMGCAECRCDLYDDFGSKKSKQLPEDYVGGLRCCVDGSRCRVRKGFYGPKRNVYLRYTVKYVEWADSIVVPVRIYVLDVTDAWKKGDEGGVEKRHPCRMEYDVEYCPNLGADEERFCEHTKTLVLNSPIDGDVIYAVGHQHAGAVGITLHGQGGREICSSFPTYGEGVEAGNEAGYVVGMSACYPLPGSVRIAYGETLTLTSNYNNSRGHVGVMGLFYLLVADTPAAEYSKYVVVGRNSGHFPVSNEIVTRMKLYGAMIGFFGVAAILVGAILMMMMMIMVQRGWNNTQNGYYEPAF